MANFQTAPKLRIVNNLDQFILTKFQKKANGAYEPSAGADAAAVIAATDLLKIEGFADLHSDKILKGVKAFAVPSQKQVSTLTVSGLVVVNMKEFSLEVEVKSYNLEHEFVRFDGHNKKSRFYGLVLKSGDTVTTVAKRISDFINLDADKDGYVFVTATSSSGVVTITSAEPGWEIDLKLSGDAIDDGNVIITPAITSAAYEGRNVYRQMNTKRLETANRVYPYAVGHYVAANEIPLKNGLYTSVISKFKVERTDLSGGEMQNSGPVSGDYEIEVYFLQGTVDVARDEYIAWLKAHAKVFVEYNATTPAQALVEEVPVVTNN